MLLYSVKMNEIESIPQLDPECAFLCICPIYYGKEQKKRHKLPNYKEMKGGEVFSICHAYWNEEGVHFTFSVKEPIQQCAFPQVDTGDGIEIYLDTRGPNAQSTFDSCTYHFAYIPEPIAGNMGGEMLGAHTRNRPNTQKEVQAKVTTHAKGYDLSWVIPQGALHGSQPKENVLWRFIYVVHRYGNTPQFFGVSEDLRWRQSPRGWGCIHFENMGKKG